MTLFLSTYVNRIDKKGRVSVPASFRAVINDELFAGIVAYNSFKNNCIEACSLSRIEKINDSIDLLDPFSDERDALATTILGNSVQLPFDPEGRVLISAEFMAFAHLTEYACFVGKGTTFEIWNPEYYNEYKIKAQEIARNNRSLISFSRRAV